MKKDTPKKHPTGLVGWFIFTLIWLIILAIGYCFMHRHVSAERHADIYSFISAIFALLSLIATFMLTDYVYRQAKRDEEQEEQKRRQIANAFLGAAVKHGVEWVICEPCERKVGACYRLREYVNRYEEALSEYLPQEELQTLLTFTETLEAMRRQDEDSPAVDRSFLFAEWLRPIMASSYSRYAVRARSYYQLLDQKLYVLLQALEIPETERAYQARVAIYDALARPLFMQTDHYPKEVDAYTRHIYDIHKDPIFMREMNFTADASVYEAYLPIVPRDKTFTAIYDEGDLVAVGILDNGGFDDGYSIRDGFVKTSAYVGYQKEYRPHGKGREYNKGHVLTEGFFLNGELVAGIEYDRIICDEKDQMRWHDETAAYEWTGDDHPAIYEQLYRKLRLGQVGLISKAYIMSIGIDSFYIADVKMHTTIGFYEYTNIRPLKAFLEKYHPELLSDLEESD